MKTPIYPPIEAIVDLHAELLAEHGGAPGIRDPGALEASLARPRQIVAYSESSVTLFDLAAALCVGISRSHPFVDGNKRAAFAALGVMLGLNGLHLDVTEREATSVMKAVAAGTMSEERLREWVANNSLEVAADTSTNETLERPFRPSRAR